MPQVPKYDNLKVAPQARPSVGIGARVSPATFGADTMRGAEDLAHVGEQIHLEGQARANEIAAQDFDRKLTAWQTDYLHNAESGALNRRGKDAFDLPKKSAEDFEKFTSEQVAALGNGAQKQIAEHLVGLRRNELNRAVQTHVAGEIKAYDDQVTKAAVETYGEAAVASYRDPEAVRLNVHGIKAALEMHGKNNGTAPEAVAAAVQQQQSAALRGVIGRFLSDGNDSEAKKTFGTWKDWLTGSDQAAIDKAMQVSTTRGESQRLSDAIVLQHQDPRDALAAAEKIEDPELRDMVVDRVGNHYQLKNQALEQFRRGQYEQASEALKASNGDTDAIDPITWSNLDLDQRQNLELRAKQMRAGEPVVTDKAVYYHLRSLASNESTRSAFLQEDLLPYQTMLSDSDWKQMVDLQADLRKDSTGATSKTLAGINTREQVVDALLIAKGIDPNVSTKKADTRAIAFRAMLDKAVLAEQANQDKPLSAEQVRAIGDRLMVDQATATPRSWYNPIGWIAGDDDETVASFELPGADKFAFSVSQVPAADHSEIVSEFTARHKRAPTEDEVIRIYNSTVSKPTDGN